MLQPLNRIRNDLVSHASSGHANSPVNRTRNNHRNGIPNCQLNTERPITGSFSGAVKGLQSLGDSSCRSKDLNSLMNDPMTAKCHSLGLSSLANDLVNLNSLWNGLWNNYVTMLFRSSSVLS